jgi:hypothetical protein
MIYVPRCSAAVLKPWPAGPANAFQTKFVSDPMIPRMLVLMGKIHHIRRLFPY